MFNRRYIFLEAVIFTRIILVKVLLLLGFHLTCITLFIKSSDKILYNKQG